MKICPVCQTKVEENAAFCTQCGYAFGGQPMMMAEPTVDPKDHTAEFDPRDIPDNKVIAMLMYLSSFIGIIIAALTANASPYVSFHMRQALKFMVVEILVGILTALTFWTIVTAVGAVVIYGILFVCKIICFFQICSGKAKEAPIISNFGFLK